MKGGLEIVIIAVLPFGVPSFQNTFLPPVERHTRGVSVDDGIVRDLL